MRRIHSLGWLGLGVFCALGLIGGEATGLLGGGISGAQAQTKIKRVRCIKAQHKNGKQSMRIELNNSCKRKIQCQLRWKVYCGQKRAMKRFSFERLFSVDSGDAHGVTASAKRCGKRAWEIKNVSWRCRSVKP